jgi:hypothetical protein
MPTANPFQELYLTEAVDDPDLYWNLFSPQVITGEAHLLFKSGNVVLLGSNGAGKTMLLRLLAPDVLSTFIARRRALPFADDGRPIVGVGVNLLHAGFGILGGRRICPDPDENVNLWSAAMGDVLNHSIIAEFLAMLRFLGTKRGEALRESINADVSQERLDAFARDVSREPYWFGALSDVSGFDQMHAKVQQRIYAYRSFSNWNTSEITSEVWSTKTETGVPIRGVVRALVRTGVLSAGVHPIVTIDQYETLMHTDYQRELSPARSIGRAFCRVVNALLAARAPELSFKLGVRHYSWGRELRVLGTDARIELGRDYQQVNLDELLRRKENAATWVFPRFAADVAARRIAAYLRKPDPNDLQDWLPTHLDALSADKEVELYVGRGSSLRAPQSPSWSREWNAYLANLWTTNKYEARLAEVWLHQTVGRGERLPSHPPGPGGPRPWAKPWWQKERREALLMQIASSAKQRRLYGGWQSIMTLSGANALVFISLCREIWEVHERNTKADVADELLHRHVNHTTQSQAIRLISELWYNKLVEFPGGSRRQSFISRLAIAIRKKLLEDRGLSNPGHNGFSLTLEEYESAEAADVKEFLDTATDFGALISSPHTTKERDRRPRVKWYPFPMLCPHFEIPAVRTKEPYYARLEEVRRWLSDDRTPIVFGLRADHDQQIRRRDAASVQQSDLFKAGGDR